MRLCAREKKIGSKFDLQSEVIFKDLAVPSCNCKANVRELVCPSYGHVLLILGSLRQVVSTLTIDTVEPLNNGRHWGMRFWPL